MVSKMDVRGSINFGLQRLGIEAIKENQLKVIEGYLRG